MRILVQRGNRGNAYFSKICGITKENGYISWRRSHNEVYAQVFRTILSCEIPRVLNIGITILQVGGGTLLGRTSLRIRLPSFKRENCNTKWKLNECLLLYYVRSRVGSIGTLYLFSRVIKIKNYYKRYIVHSILACYY